MTPHSSTPAWKIPWTEEPGRLQSMGSLESDTTERLHFPFSLSCTAEGNGNPLQCSCLENPRDGEAWWAAVYGVAQSWTRLKWLSSKAKYQSVWLHSFKIINGNNICTYLPHVNLCWVLWGTQKHIRWPVPKCDNFIWVGLCGNWLGSG